MYLPEFDEIFKQIYYNLRLSGVFFDESVIGLRFFIPFVVLHLMIIEEFSFFTSRISSENFLELTALAPCLGIGVLSVLKIMTIVYKRHKISHLISGLRPLYQEILDDVAKRELVTTDIIRVKSLTKYYFILNAILISVYNFSTLIFMSYNYIMKEEVVFSLPYAVIVPFSTDTWPTWFVVYTHSITCGFICVLYYTTTDALYCNLASQVCSNFAILSNEIRLLDETKVGSIRELIKKHQHILQLSEILEDVFTLPNFYNVIVGSVEICALGFNIMMGEWSLLPGYILFLVSELLQILVMSVFGENILRESVAVGQAAFTCDWYKMDQKSKKSILILITRANKPQVLTAYKFSVISYKSFTTIISTSWSYFTILKTVYKPSDVAV